MENICKELAYIVDFQYIQVIKKVDIMKGKSLYTMFSEALSSEEKAIKYFEKMRW